MSTRANIILKEGKEQVIFYKHWDGSPESVTPMLDKFASLIKSGEFRNNLCQCSGWLILFGAMENKVKLSDKVQDFTPEDWKCGSIEITTDVHGDIDYLYTFDVVKATYKIKKTDN